MDKIPKLKKKINAFLTKEDGKISKENLVKTGVLLGAVSLGSVLAAKNTAAAVIHSNSLGVSYDSAGSTATGTHGHHASHSSHSSHGSHGSHNSW